MEIIVDLITPFQNNGEIDQKAIEALLEKLLLENAGSVSVNGLAGEAFALSYEEKKEIIKVVSRYNEYIDIYSGLTESTIEDNLKFVMDTDIFDFKAYIIYFRQLGCLSPFELNQYIEELLKLTEKKLILFNDEFADIAFDKLSGRNLEAVIFQKYQNNFHELKRFSAENNVKAFLGNERQLYDCLENRFDGILSSSANFFYKEFWEIINYDDHERFLIYQEKLKRIHTKEIPVVIKSLINEFLFSVGGVRPPLTDLHFYEKECYFKRIL